MGAHLAAKNNGLSASLRYGFMAFQKHSTDEARKKISSLAPLMTRGPLALTLQGLLSFNFPQHSSAVLMSY